jgi:hypothetical protein
MEKKLRELVLKTGISEKEAAGFSRAGLLGALAAAVLGLFGCARNVANVRPASEPPAPAVSKPVRQTVERVLDEVAKTTSPAQAPINPGEECGPYPGYPCGTRYFTVSPFDFRGRA